MNQVKNKISALVFLSLILVACGGGGGGSGGAATNVIEPKPVINQTLLVMITE